MFGSRDRFKLVPDNTSAIAEIKKAIKIEGDNGTTYIKIFWIITSFNHKGVMIRQNLYINNPDADKKVRARRMLMRIFRISEQTFTGNEPSANELASLLGTHAKLKISLFEKPDGSKNNWVTSVSQTDNLSYDYQKKTFFGEENWLKNYPKPSKLFTKNDNLEDLDF